MDNKPPDKSYKIKKGAPRYKIMLWPNPNGLLFLPYPKNKSYAPALCRLTLVIQPNLPRAMSVNLACVSYLQDAYLWQVLDETDNQLDRTQVIHEV